MSTASVLSSSGFEAIQLFDATPESRWAEFASFEYQGGDAVYDQHPPAANEFYNPILSGFYADPSVCRVGDDFYLVNSSFSYFPGVPIFHSKNLVDWKQLGYVLDRPSQLDLDGLPVSSGIFAPTISFHDGLFTMVTTNVRGIGNFYVTAETPAGPWSEPIRLPQINGIDPSFFFDEDGRAYLVHNGHPPEDQPLYEGHRAIWLWEFDLKAQKIVGEGQIIVNGGVDISQKPIWIEGPHLFKRNGYYYICAAEGGTSVGHSQVILRSKSVNGPYEPFAGNPILTQRNLDPNRPHPITSVGHADLVETPNGEWWAVFLGVRPYEGNKHNIGRETFLLPVRWENDWPIILDNGQEVPRVLPRPNLPAASAPSNPTTGSFAWRDDFDSPNLALEWNFLRTPRQKWWTLGEDSLRIAPRAVTLNAVYPKDSAADSNPSFIARHQQHTDFSVATTLVFNADAGSHDAGVAALQNDTTYLFLGVQTQNGVAKRVFLEECSRATKRPEIRAQADLPEGVQSIELKIAGEGKNYSFFYRLNDGEWMALKENVDGSLLSSEVAGGFVGTFLGMFARSL